MTYEIYRYIFVGGAVLSLLMLIVSIVLFFLLKIPNVIGDLSGVNAKKGIESIRNKNANTGKKTFASSAVNRERGKITDKISYSGHLAQKALESSGEAMATGKISTGKLSERARISAFGETELLEEKTACGETTVLNLTPDIGETVVLGEDERKETSADTVPRAFEIEYEITYIFSDEIIV